MRGPIRDGRYWAIGISPWIRPRESSISLAWTWSWPRVRYFVLVGALVLNIIVSSVWIAATLSGAKDLDSFLHSAAAYAAGLNPYDYYPWLDPAPISPQALNLNPPISVYLFQPLLDINRGVLGSVFLAGSVAMIAAAVALLMRAYQDKRHWLFVLVVLAMAGTWQMLFYVQLYAPLILAMTGAWLLMRRGDMLLAGVLIGVIIAVKPNYALVALALLVAGHYRPALASGVTAAAISAVPILIDGPGIYLQWLHLTSGFDGYAWTSNASLVSITERLGTALPGQIATAVFVVGILVFLRKRRPKPLDAVAVGVMSVLLVGPVSWAGYTLLLLPYLFSIRWDQWTWLGVGMLVAPFAPLRVIEVFDVHGSGVSSAVGSSASFFSTLIPSPLLTTAGAVVLPLIAAIYAWAVVLLFTRLTIHLWEAGEPREVEVRAAEPATRKPGRIMRAIPRPVAVYPARTASGVRGSASQMANEHARQNAAPVRVRYNP